MNRRNFIQLMGCGCLSLSVNNCSTAPITDRKQLKLIPEHKLNAQASKAYEKVKKKAKLSDDIKKLTEIKEIGKNIEVAISKYFASQNIVDPTIGFEWEYILIDNDKVLNAWCMPGGKIAIYSGILKVSKDTNGLAAVMGHEIAHAVAKHSVERMSRAVLVQSSVTLIDVFTGGKLSQVNRSTGLDAVGYVAQLGIMNPFSRKEETEADYLGMIFASLAGYDIRETPKIWERMKLEFKGKEPPQFMSTHPSSSKRINNINEWMNEIIIKYPPIT